MLRPAVDKVTNNRISMDKKSFQALEEVYKKKASFFFYTFWYIYFISPLTVALYAHSDTRKSNWRLW